MLGLSEIRQTKVYQDALQESEQIGEQRGRTEEARGSLVLRQLARRGGTHPAHVEATSSDARVAPSGGAGGNFAGFFGSWGPGAAVGTELLKLKRNRNSERFLAEAKGKDLIHR